MTNTETNWFTFPGNLKDRERFYNRTEWAQERVRNAAFRLYDGTRTIARCWTLALDADDET